MSDETTLPPVDRRVDDPRISQLVQDMAGVKIAHVAMQKSLDENTVVTNQVRDILTSFAIAGKIAKWVSAIAGAIAAIWAAKNELRF